MELGGGRRKKEDKIDYGAGIFIPKKIGDYVDMGDIIGTLYTSKEKVDKKIAVRHLQESFYFSRGKSWNQ